MLLETISAMFSVLVVGAAEAARTVDRGCCGDTDALTSFLRACACCPCVEDGGEFLDGL
jgi:hypothetical protein